jgi:membrane-bound ClpP family serine protease
VTSHGALTLCGLVCLALGSIMLFQNTPGFHTSKPLVISIAVALGLIWTFAISKALQLRGKPAAVDPRTIVGTIGEVKDNGLVYANGELWQAHTPGGEPLRPGEHVRIESLDGLVLTVTPEAV